MTETSVQEGGEAEGTLYPFLSPSFNLSLLYIVIIVNITYTVVYNLHALIKIISIHNKNVQQNYVLQIYVPSYLNLL